MSIRLFWSPAAGADGYQVFRGKITSGPWVLLTPQPTTDTSYTDQPVVPSTTIVYKVNSVLRQPGDRQVLRAPSAPVSVTTAQAPATVTGIGVISSSPYSLVMGWNAIPGAHHYAAGVSVPWVPACGQAWNTEVPRVVVNFGLCGGKRTLFSVAPVYRLARFPTERDTTDVVGPRAQYWF